MFAQHKEDQPVKKQCKAQLYFKPPIEESRVQFLCWYLIFGELDLAPNQTHTFEVSVRTNNANETVLTIEHDEEILLLRVLNAYHSSTWRTWSPLKRIIARHKAMNFLERTKHTSPID